MATPNVPIIFNEAINLQQLGVPETSIKHGLTTIESDNWIVCVESTQVTLIDLKNGAQISRKPINAEAAIMNPTSNIIALRSGVTVQIFNLDLKQRLKSHTMPEHVVYWTWTNSYTMAMVTGAAVYHWSLTGEDAPEKIFERHQSIGSGTQIINYQVAPDGKWCLLGGISAGAGGTVNGNMQLYSVDKKVSQPLQGHAGAFAVINIIGREDPAQLLVFHEKKSDSGHGSKLFVMEVGRDPLKGPGFRLQPTAIPVPVDASSDFPVSLVIDKKNDIAFLITKMGYLYMFDIHTGKVIYRAKITTETVFCTCSQETTGAMFGITVKRGQVICIMLNNQALIPYILSTLRDNELAIKLAGRLGLPGAENLFSAEFERLISSGHVVEAAKLVANGGTFLRTPATIARFQQVPGEPGSPQPVFQYFSTLLETGRLNEQESIELAKPVLQQGRPQLMEKWLKDDKLQCSEALGDLIMPSDVGMALSVYLRSECHAKAINCLSSVVNTEKLCLIRLV